jgi:hypothetical protein
VLPLENQRPSATDLGERVLAECATQEGESSELKPTRHYAMAAHRSSPPGALHQPRTSGGDFEL